MSENYGPIEDNHFNDKEAEEHEGGKDGGE
jgi:hypothetical protein